MYPAVLNGNLFVYHRMMMGVMESIVNLIQDESSVSWFKLYVFSFFYPSLLESVSVCRLCYLLVYRVAVASWFPAEKQPLWHHQRPRQQCHTDWDRHQVCLKSQWAVTPLIIVDAFVYIFFIFKWYGTSSNIITDGKCIINKIYL